MAKSMKAVANVGGLKLDQFNVDAASKVSTKFGHFVPAGHASTKTPVTLMINPERPLSRKNQNSFSLYPSTSFEDDVDPQLVVGDGPGADGDNDVAKSHGEQQLSFLLTLGWISQKPTLLSNDINCIGVLEVYLTRMTTLVTSLL